VITGPFPAAGGGDGGGRRKSTSIIAINDTDVMTGNT
jgi:hypothetical protein